MALKTILRRITATALVRPVKTVPAVMLPPVRPVRTTAIRALMIIAMPGGHAFIR